MFYLLSCFLAGLLFMAFPASGADASPIPLCGVVEGFYGTPWSHKNRQDMLEFCGEQGLNAYIYAPKNDPYHKDRWREPYPKNQQEKLAELARTADKHHVELIFAIFPGIHCPSKDRPHFRRHRQGFSGGSYRLCGNRHTQDKWQVGRIEKGQVFHPYARNGTPAFFTKLQLFKFSDYLLT